MKEEPKTKCSEHNFAHSWVDITPSIMYPTNPPRYPNKQEQCQNCGLIRTHQKKIEEWYDYEIKELPQKCSIVTIPLVCSGGISSTADSTNVLNI